MREDQEKRKPRRRSHRPGQSTIQHASGSNCIEQLLGDGLLDLAEPHYGWNIEERLQNLFHLGEGLLFITLDVHLGVPESDHKWLVGLELILQRQDVNIANLFVQD